MYTIKKLLELQEMKSSEFVDIQEVTINQDVSKIERLELFLTQVKNPYHFKCGNVKVHLQYDNKLEKIEDKLLEFLIAKNCVYER